MSPVSRKIPALLTKNSAQPCQTESYGEIMLIRVRPTDDDDDDDDLVNSISIVNLKQRLPCKSALAQTPI